ncbi:MAG TPA: winged helix-turn-helix transcriptional regulator [Treponemataceae bacterium]|nr:winged helix-turn-helix transcriptional regulator [Treponemataceae bacterium]
MNESDITVLSHINKTLEHNPHARQREIAQHSNLSLGMTNAILKRFVEKGWICLKKLNSRTMQYIVTPEGLAVVSKRSYKYFKRTFSVVQTYKDKIQNILIDAKTKGIKKVILVGDSDLQFVIEWACNKHGVVLGKQKKITKTTNPDTLVFVGEATDTVQAAGTVVKLIDLIGVEV